MYWYHFGGCFTFWWSEWIPMHTQGCKLSWSSHNLYKISLYATKYLFYLQSYVNSLCVTPLKTNCCKKMRIYHTAMKLARFIHIMLRKNFLNSQQWGKILEFLATTWGCRVLQKNCCSVHVSPKKIDEQSAGNLKVSEKAKLLICNSWFFELEIYRVRTHLESPWILQSVLESPWISVLTLSNPDPEVPNMKDLKDKIAHAVVELKKT